MKLLKNAVMTVLLLAAMWAAPAAHAQSKPAPTPSAPASPPSAIPADKKAAGPEWKNIEPIAPIRPANPIKTPVSDGASPAHIASACMAAAEELEKTRALAEKLDAENAALYQRLDTEKRTAALLTELNETRKSESASLRAAIQAQNDAIAAKNEVIATQNNLITSLKSKRVSPIRRIGDILLGAAVFAVLK